MKAKLIAALILTVCFGTVLQAENLSKEALLNRIVEKATESERVSANYGFNADMIIRWLGGDGRTSKTETRDYRTVWIGDAPRLQLVHLNDKELTPEQKAQEAKKQQEWRQSLQNGTVKPDSAQKLPVTWKELCDKYNFTVIPSDKSAAYVLRFTPRRGKLLERTRIEKVLNHLNGTVWVDDQFNIVKFQGHLSENVSFGFGLAKVDQMEVNYTQRSFQGISVPASLELKVRVKALLFFAERRQISTSFSNYHPFTTELAEVSTTGSGPGSK